MTVPKKIIEDRITSLNIEQAELEAKIEQIKNKRYELRKQLEILYPETKIQKRDCQCSHCR